MEATVTVTADTAPALLASAAAMRSTAEAYGQLTRSCLEQAELLEAEATGAHAFVYDRESGDCGRCAFPDEHPVHIHPFDPDGRCTQCGHRAAQHGAGGCAADDEAAMGGCACFVQGTPRAATPPASVGPGGSTERPFA